MSDQEEIAPSAPVSEIGDDEAGSDAEQASTAHKRRKTGLTKCEDEYAVSNRLTLPAHGFGVPDLYPERVYDDFHDEGYDSV